MSTKFLSPGWRMPRNANQSKQSNYSMDFDGTQGVNIDSDPLKDGSNNFTFSVWVKLNVTDFTAQRTIFQNWSSSTFILRYKNGKLEIYINGSKRGTDQTLASLNLNNNNWHNLLIVNDYDNSELKIYVDNTLKHTNTGVQVAYPSNTNTLQIGSGFSYWTGKLDSVAIFNYALSSSQITTLYGSSSTGIGNPMSLSPKPVAYYPLGDQDAFNGSNYLVPNSSLKDYVFDFNNDNVLFNTLNLGTQSTESFWVKRTTSNSSLWLGRLGATGTNQSGYPLFLTSSKIYTRITTSGGYQQLNISTPNDTWMHICRVRNGNNTSVYVSYSGTFNQNSGVNNFSTFSGLENEDTIISEFTGNSGNIFKASNWQFFNLALSLTEVETLYNYGSPIQTLANIPQNSNLQGWYKLDASATYDGTNWTIPDDSTNSNTGTSSGMTQANLVQSDLSFTSGYSPYALDFDGATDYIRILPFGTGMTLSDSWSVSIWINTTTTLGNKGILTSRNQSGPFDFFSFGPKTKSNGKIETYLEGIGYTEITPVINDGNWHHLTFAYNHSSTTIKVYTDNSESYSSTSYDNGTGRVLETIGAAYTSWYWIGKLSNLSVWNKQLTPSEVTEIYNEGVPSNLNNHSAYSNLVSWWQLGSNSSFSTNWTVLNEISTGTNGTSVGMTEADIVDGVGSYANGTSSGMAEGNLVGDAPYSTSNALSSNMAVTARVTGSGNTP